MFKLGLTSASISRIYYPFLKINVIKTRQMLETNEMNVLRKIVGKTSIVIVLSQQIRESYGIQPINE